MQTGGITNADNIFYSPDFNNRGIVIALNLMNSLFGFRKMKNFPFMQQKLEFVGHKMKIQGRCFLKNRGFLTGTK